MRSVAHASRLIVGLLAITLIAASVTGCTRLKVRRLMHEANALYKAEKYEEAIEHYKQIVSLDGSYSDAWLNMGYAYRSLYRPGSTHPKDAEYAEAGIEAFQKFLDINPDSDEGRQYLIDFCTVAQRHDDAIAFYKRELERLPGNAELIKSLASLYSDKGDTDEELKWRSRWTELEPDNPEAWYTIGVTCWSQSYYNKFMSNDRRRLFIETGVEALEKALELKTEYFEALSYMNLIYREKAKLEAMEGNPLQAGTDYATADQYTKKALEIRNKQLE